MRLIQPIDGKQGQVGTLVGVDDAGNQLSPRSQGRHDDPAFVQNQVRRREHLAAHRRQKAGTSAFDLAVFAHDDDLHDAVPRGAGAIPRLGGIPLSLRWRLLRLRWGFLWLIGSFGRLIPGRRRLFRRWRGLVCGLGGRCLTF